jgi:hypothetical protein
MNYESLEAVTPATARRDPSSVRVAHPRPDHAGQFVGKTPIPERGDIPGMAAYWKKYYNTEQGAGSPAQFVANWESEHGAVA